MISTNLIIGRLGVGKTATLQHLLQQKPGDEFWAILINEFGQLGIDTALLKPASTDQLSITEVSGGCICCAAQSQLKITLTRLIREHKPQRLLIEPTGLGHPAGIVDLLRDDYLAKVIRLETIICIADPRDFNDDLLTRSQTFRQQLELADCVVLNKTDLSSREQIKKAKDYLAKLYPPKQQIMETVFGDIDLELLTRSTAQTQSPFINPVYRLMPHAHQQQTEIPIASSRIQRISASQEGHQTIAWLIPLTLQFNRRRLEQFFQRRSNTNDYKRIKGVFNCGKNWYSYNWVGDPVRMQEAYYRRDSRLEIIIDSTATDLDAFESEFLASIRS